MFQMNLIGILRTLFQAIALCAGLLASAVLCRAAELEAVIPVAAQPLSANVKRLVEALDFLGAPLSEEVKKSLAEAARKPDAVRLQEVLDEHALFITELNPESRVKVRRGRAKAALQQGGYVPIIIKIVN